MCIIYNKPTVREVIFQIQFPNLLFIEKHIGDYQYKIMSKFPDSSELIQKQLMFKIIDDSKIQKEEISNNEPAFQKIWQFSSEEGYKLSVSSNSISIVSELHKTYRNPSGEHRFRDIIEYCINNFLEIIQLPTIKRIGLRYIDDCPLPQELNNPNYESYYNTSFPLNIFDISKAKDIQFLINIEEDNNAYLRYQEIFKDNKLVIDFDAYKNNINPEEYLQTTDLLYEIVHNKFESTIKEPVREIMQG